ncbi:MAG: hypothetical protein JKY01_10810 [Pseudomonadales bacterium]|nr:hypothetical protein [Pseudomonadales bacterium]
MANNGLAFLFEQFDRLLLFFDQGVDFGGFVVEGKCRALLCSYALFE